MTEPLVEACEMGEKVLTDLMGTVTEEDSRFESKGLSPAFLVCDILLMIHTWLSSRRASATRRTRGCVFAIP